MKLTLIILFLASSVSFSQYSEKKQQAIDSLKSIAESNAHDTIRIKAYLDWDNYIYQDDIDLDIKIGRTVLKLTQNGLEKKGISPAEHEFYYEKRSMCYNILGLGLCSKGNYIESQKYFEKCVSAAEMANDTNHISSGLNGLGMIMQIQGNYEKSISYYEKCLEMIDDDDYSIGIFLNNIGLSYYDLGKPKLAINTYQKSLYHSGLAGDMFNQANTLGNIAEIYFKAGNKDSAFYYLNKALDLDEAAGASAGNIFRRIKLGYYYQQSGQAENGLTHCLIAEELNKENYTLSNHVDCHECLYLCYKDLSRIDKAFHHLEQYKQLNDSLNKETATKEILEKEYNFTYEKQRIEDSLAIANQQTVKEIQLKADLTSKTYIQYILYLGIVALLIIAFAIFRNYKIKKKDNEVISAQKRMVENQKHLVEEKNQEITDSITYAKRLQEAILPSQDKIKAVLTNSFVLYLPKDIVAGDFYWIEESGSKVLFAIADCTGHGVPGALVSVVCNNALNRAVREFALTKPSEILDKTRELVIETFKSSDTTVKDGMDITLCCFDRSSRKLEYAGANNSLYLLREGELIEYKADKQPIGTYSDPKQFTNHHIEVIEDDQIFLFTDGFADQFGGEKGKKYKYKPFKNFLIANAKNSSVKQKAALENEFSTWLGDYEQIDDVCIMGVKFNHQ